VLACVLRQYVEQKCIVFLWENLKERDNLENLGLDRILYNQNEHVDWINLVKNSNMWQAVLNMIIQLEVP
jgi:hypothetical protein